MSAGDHGERQGSGSAGTPLPAPAVRGARLAAEADALDRLPDCEIAGALCALPPELRLAVYLADVEGYCYQDIAGIMGTPVGTVASRLHHGRVRLRERLARSAAQRGLAVSPG